MLTGCAVIVIGSFAVGLLIGFADALSGGGRHRSHGHHHHRFIHHLKHGGRH